jgi:hypothetical protein
LRLVLFVTLFKDSKNGNLHQNGVGGPHFLNSLNP